MVFVCYAVSSQHVSGLPGDVQGLTTWVPFQHGDHLWCVPFGEMCEKVQWATGFFWNETAEVYFDKAVSSALLEMFYITCYTLKHLSRLRRKTHFFWSMSLPSCKQDCSPSVISVSMSAIFFCMSWFLASGTPNWILHGKIIHIHFCFKSLVRFFVVVAKKLMLLFSKDWLNWSKVAVKTFIMLQK